MLGHNSIDASYRAGCWSGSPALDGYWAQDGMMLMNDNNVTFGIRRMVWIENRLSRMCRQTLLLAECKGCLYPKDKEYLEQWK